jgi:di/tripeptidase
LVDQLGLSLKSNLILMGSSKSLGRGNLAGLRFFLENNDMPITAGICVEGAQLGRLSIASIGMARGEIHCGVSQSYDWTRFGTTNAIITMNEVINRIMMIPTPLRPRSSIVLGTIEGGKDFNTLARFSKLGFEIRSEEGEVVEQIEQHLDDIVAEVGSQTESDVNLEIFARRSPGGLGFAHPLARHVRRIMQALDIPQRAFPSTSELSAFIDRGIPAVTIGLTSCESLNEKGEEVFIEPMFAGLAQLLGIILAIDGGFCDED